MTVQRDQSTDYCYLCGECGGIARVEEFAHLQVVFEGPAEGRYRLSEDGESDPRVRCPFCGEVHADDDSGVGLWGGTRAEMERERAQIEGDYADLWSENGCA